MFANRRAPRTFGRKEAAAGVVEAEATFSVAILIVGVGVVAAPFVIVWRRGEVAGEMGDTVGGGSSTRMAEKEDTGWDGVEGGATST